MGRAYQGRLPWAKENDTDDPMDGITSEVMCDCESRPYQHL